MSDAKGLCLFLNSKLFDRTILRNSLILFGITLIGLLPLLLSDFSYIDDLNRVVFGYKKWDYFSRYFSVGLSVFLHANKNFLADISPFPQILAVFLISYTAALIFYVLTDGQKGNFWKLLPCIPITLSPYFLECLSFKYDSPYMAISILTCVIPFLFLQRPIVFFASSVIGVLVCVMSYQASLGVYCMMTLAICFCRYTKGESLRSLLPFVLLAAGAFFCSLIIFKYLILTPVDTYVSSSISLSSLIPNIKKYLSLLNSDFGSWIKVLVLVNFLCFIFTSLRSTKLKSFIFLGVAAITVLLLFSFALGLYPLLTKPSFRPRGMIGLGVFLGIITILITRNSFHFSKSFSVIVLLPPLLLSWYFFVFVLIYGNALEQQKQYIAFRTQLIVNELNTLLNRKEKYEITLTGTAGLAPALRKLHSYYPLVKRLIPTQLGQGSIWGSTTLQNYYGLYNCKFTQINKRSFKSYPIIRNNYYQAIRMQGNHVVINLKR